MKPRLQTSLGQQLVLTPQLRQAIHLLQLSTLELEAEIAAAVEANPMLEWDEDGGEGDLIAGERETSVASESDAQGEEAGALGEGEAPLDVEWNDDGEADWSGSGAPGSGDGEFDAAENSAEPETLQDHLLWQLHMAHLDARDRSIALAMIEAIDEDGYLREPLQDIAASLAPDITASEADIHRVLHHVQAMDPTGVGARNLGECLCLQLHALPEDTPYRDVALRLCDGSLEQLPKAGIEGIARTLRVDQEQAAGALALLRSLDPRPGARHGAMPRDTWVTPDAVILRQQGVWRVQLAQSQLSRLGIHRTYERLAASTKGDDGKYLRGQLQEARWLLKNIEARGETLLRVVQSLVDAQAGFLEFGPRALRPLTLREIAGELGLHESTISRAISRKYVRTPRGTIALRDFFASGVGNSEGGETSSTAIQDMIRKLVAEENPRKPLSDARLTTELKARGISVARRTVAKYREAMGIASSHERMGVG